MRLLDICEPLFQYICRLNRLGRKDGRVDYSDARAEVDRLFESMRSQTNGNSRLQQSFSKVELPLVFFVDSMISESRLPCATEWNSNRLAYDYNELAGDEKFFDLLDETLSESSDEAAERLEIFFVCLGLGFQGWYAGDLDTIRRKMADIAPRLRHLQGGDSTGRLCPDGYSNVDTRDLIEPPSYKIAGIGIVVAGLAIVVLVANIVLYNASTSALNHSLEEIERADVNKAQQVESN